jgi:hypothetical protein
MNRSTRTGCQRRAAARRCMRVWPWPGPSASSAASPRAASASACAVRQGLTSDGLAAKIGARATKGAAVMSELDVIIIHIRAEQAAEYERLFAERELPRWREYKERGAFISARIFRAAFGTDRREDRQVRHRRRGSQSRRA